jgi:hypothetical protein
MKNNIRRIFMVCMIGIIVAVLPSDVSPLGSMLLPNVASGQGISPKMVALSGSSLSFMEIGAFVALGSGFTSLVVWRRKKRFE